MMATAESFILDCSVTMAWCFEDEITEYSEDVFNTLTYATALVPTIWPLEVANVLLMAERKNRISSVKVSEFKEALKDLSIRVIENTGQRALGSVMELAKELHLTVYDAAYLDLALNTDLPLATLDNSLKKAASKLNVPLFLLT